MCRKYFSVDGDKVSPLEYAKFMTPLARGAVRLGVFRLLDEDAGGLAGKVQDATKEIASKFPAGDLMAPCCKFAHASGRFGH